MEIFNKTFNNVDEVAQYIADNISEIQKTWYSKNVHVTADKKWQVHITNDPYYLDDSVSCGQAVIKTIEYHEDERRVIGCDYAYHISQLNIEENFLDARCCGMYQVAEVIIGLFNQVLLPGDRFVFDEPCDGKGYYDIYAIENVSGIIMAEFIRNSTKHRGLDTREVGAKGTESWAMVEAWRKYEKGEGHMEFDPEAAKDGAYTVGI